MAKFEKWGELPANARIEALYVIEPDDPRIVRPMYDVNPTMMENIEAGKDHSNFPMFCVINDNILVCGLKDSIQDIKGRIIRYEKIELKRPIRT